MFHRSAAAVIKLGRVNAAVHCDRLLAVVHSFMCAG